MSSILSTKYKKVDQGLIVNNNQSTCEGKKSYLLCPLDKWESLFDFHVSFIDGSDQQLV